MSRNYPECPNPDDPDRGELPNVLVRQEPDEEEDEEEEEDESNGKDDNDQHNDDEGYSE